MKEKFLLIDGSSLLFRAFYAIRDLKTKNGIYVNGVYGFLAMYYNMLEKYTPDYICVAFDRPGPTFRQKDYALYKANRQKTPDELNFQFGLTKGILDALNVKYLDYDNYEADDICGTLSKIAEKKGIESIFVTGDRDYLQLINESSKVVLTKKGVSQVKEYDERVAVEEYGIKPSQFIEIKGLMGDSSDNIPGVPGVGEKTAFKLIKEFGNIDGIYDNLDKISGKKLKENLEENKKLAYMSRSLGEIFTNIKMDENLENYRVKEPNYEDLREKYESLEFRKYLKMIEDKFEIAKPDKEYLYDFINKSNFENILEQVKNDKIFYFDFIFSDSDYIRNNPEFLAIMSKSSDVVYIVSLYLDNSLDFMKNLFENSDVLKIGSDIKSAMYYLRSQGIDFISPYEDISIGDYLLNPSKFEYSIKRQTYDYFSQEIEHEDNILGKGRDRKKFSEIDMDILGGYASSLINNLIKLREVINDEIKEKNMDELYFKIELPLIKVLMNMEYEGFKINKKYLEDLKVELSNEVDEIEKKIYCIAGEEFNINSSKQLGEILFHKRNLPVIKKTKTGFSTDIEVLEKLKGHDEIIDFIIKHRTLKKIISTYIEGILALVTDDDKIHTKFKQNITSTGRISSIEPNLQNIPIRTDIGRRIRKAFISSNGYTLVDADYSQIELRVLAHLSKDKKMVESFKNDLDIHRKTASEVFHVPLDKVTDEQRSHSKSVNFGIIYGISDYGLSKDLNITRKEAKDYIEKYLATYPEVKIYMDNIVKLGERQGYVETLFNRRRYIPELNSKNFNIRSFGERVALNTPIQGTAADIIKIAMVNIFEEFTKRKLKSKLILQVHDELIVETADDELQEVKDLLTSTMEKAISLIIPLKVDVEVGDSWYDTK